MWQTKNKENYHSVIIDSFVLWSKLTFCSQHFLLVQDCLLTKLNIALNCNRFNTLRSLGHLFFLLLGLLEVSYYSELKMFYQILKRFVFNLELLVHVSYLEGTFSPNCLRNSTKGLCFFAVLTLELINVIFKITKVT